MLLGTLGASLLGNMSPGKGVIRAGKGTIRVVYESKGSSIKKIFLIPPHPLKNFEMQMYIIRMNLDSTEFILEIICPIK